MADFKKIGQWGADNLVGILAMIAGFILVAITYKIVINAILFAVGIFLVYFGLVRLKLKPLTDIMDKIGKKLKSIISSK